MKTPKEVALNLLEGDDIVHFWKVHHDHGDWKNKVTTLATKEKSERAVRKRFANKENVKIHSIEHISSGPAGIINKDTLKS